MSMKLTPAAATSTTTWPGPAMGSGRSPRTMTSGPPSSLTTIARMTPRPFAPAVCSHLPPGTPITSPLPPLSGQTPYRALGDVTAEGVTAARPRAEMVPMPTISRRVVTGHDARGGSVFTSDGAVPAAGTAPSGTVFYEIWATGATPAPIGADAVDAVSPAPGALSAPP